VLFIRLSKDFISSFSETISFLSLLFSLFAATALSLSFSFELFKLVFSLVASSSVSLCLFVLSPITNLTSSNHKDKRKKSLAGESLKITDI